MNVPYMNSENGMLLKSIVTFSSSNLSFFVSGRVLVLLMSVTFLGNKFYLKILFDFFFNHSKFELKFNRSYNLIMFLPYPGVK